jgi:hypothetical protein
MIPGEVPRPPAVSAVKRKMQLLRRSNSSGNKAQARSNSVELLNTKLIVVVAIS